MAPARRDRDLARESTDGRGAMPARQQVLGAPPTWALVHGVTAQSAR